MGFALYRFVYAKRYSANPTPIEPLGKKVFSLGTSVRPLALRPPIGELCTALHLTRPNMANLFNTFEESEQTRKDRIFQREFYPLMDAVWSYAYRLTTDREQADDLVQETYLKVWHFMHRYTEDTFAKAWLFRICRNAFINEYRIKKSRPYKQDFEDIVVYHNEDDPVSPRYFGLHEEMNHSLMGDEMTRALSKLKPDFRTVVLLDLEDFTYEEIAAILDIPIGTVRSRLHRARNVLAEKLRDYAEGFGYGVSDNEEGKKSEDADAMDAQPIPAAA